jgi:hypothetical protein
MEGVMDPGRPSPLKHVRDFATMPAVFAERPGTCYSADLICHDPKLGAFQ